MNPTQHSLAVRVLGGVFADKEALLRMYWGYVWISVVVITFTSKPHVVLPAIVGVGILIGVMEKCQDVLQGQVCERPKYSFWSTPRLYVTIVAVAWGFGWLVSRSPAETVDVYAKVLWREMIPGFVTAVLAPVLGSINAQWVCGVASTQEENGHAGA